MFIRVFHGFFRRSERPICKLGGIREGGIFLICEGGEYFIVIRGYFGGVLSVEKGAFLGVERQLFGGRKAAFLGVGRALFGGWNSGVFRRGKGGEKKACSLLETRRMESV